MSIQLRWEQCCESQGCKRPARYGDLCTACFLAATPARRAVELGADARDRHEGAEARRRRELGADARGPREITPSGESVVGPEGAAWLRDLWAA